MEWSDDIIARLRALWAEGLTTAEIGRRLGISKNSVVGKAHRLDLPARPSPIRRDAFHNVQRRAPAPRRVQGATLPPLSTAISTASGSPASACLDRALTRAIESAVDAGRPAAATRPGLVSPVARPVLRGAVCCWPIGEPGKPAFHFCGAAAMSGKPYCAAHAEIAYVRVRDRREDAA